MSDCTCGGCPSGDYGCGCCCASVTGLRGGIHPDYIKSISADMAVDLDGDTKTFQTRAILDSPVHIVSVSISLVCLRRNAATSTEAGLKKQIQEVNTTALATLRPPTPINVSLFTLPSYSSTTVDFGGWNTHVNTIDGRTYISTCSVNSYSPNWTSPDDLFGYFCDGGLFIEVNAPTTQYGLRVVVNYVDRASFSPAYGDPVAVLQHYWSCAHGETEFLEGFYGGNSSNTGSSGTSTATEDTSIAGSGTNPWTIATDLTEMGF